MDDPYEMALIGDEPDYDAEPVAPSDEIQADRWLAALCHYERVKAHDTRLFDARMDALTQRHAEVTARFDGRIDWLRHALEQYQRARFERDGIKTLRLPHGDLKSTALRDVWDFSDEFIDWAQEHCPEVLRVRTEVIKADAQAFVEKVEESTGGTVPGVTVTPAAERGGRSYKVVPVTKGDAE